MKRFVVLMLTLTVAALVGACAKKEPAKTTSAAAPALPADMQQIAEATTTSATTTAATATAADGNTFSATGEFVSPLRSELSPKLPGRVAKMYADEGSLVRKGQPLLELETDYPQLNLRSAEADVQRARAAMDDAARDLDRKKELIAKDSIPRATYDRSQAAYEQAQAAYASATARTALFRQQIADSIVRSPVDGVVAEKRTDVGARLGDQGVAFVVVQISPIRLRFEVPERYLGRIRTGDRVSARVDPYPNEKFDGTIRTIGGVIDPKTRTMFAEAEFANVDHRLRPGLFAKVETNLQ